ncbi:MAG TPA: glycerophosphodiester phosphodiesterase family protein [bacterium]|nr:glycerophosphodiester phosphodiesterase family protein [bacterium]
MAIIVGHKGAAGYAPENTLTSFREAIKIGCDRTELDVRLTKDKQVVVIHDKEVSKLTDGTGLVNEMNLLELKKLRCLGNEFVPTLQEVINICKDKIDLQIELKAEGTPQPVSDLITQNGIEDQVFITSFKIDLLVEIKKLNPGLRVGLLFRNEEIMADIWNLINQIPLDFLAPFSEIITAEFVTTAHSLGQRVYAYQVNSKELGDKLIAMGVDEIGTDFPKLFVEPKIV